MVCCQGGVVRSDLQCPICFERSSDLFCASRLLAPTSSMFFGLGTNNQFSSPYERQVRCSHIHTLSISVRARSALRYVFLCAVIIFSSLTSLAEFIQHWLRDLRFFFFKRGFISDFALLLLSRSGTAEMGFEAFAISLLSCSFCPDFVVSITVLARCESAWQLQGHGTEE